MLLSHTLRHRERDLLVHGGSNQARAEWMVAKYCFFQAWYIVF